MVCYGSEWGEMLISTPASEPPPPYSPPRSKSKLVPKVTHAHYDHRHITQGLDTKETLPMALNHCPLSAFTPPPPRLIKCDPHANYPPPYSSLPAYNIDDRKYFTPYPGIITKDIKNLRDYIPHHTSNRGVPNHPMGPVLKVGKSLGFPKKGVVPAQGTAHKHPSEKELIFRNCYEVLNTRLAYVGIAPTTETQKVLGMAPTTNPHQKIGINESKAIKSRTPPRHKNIMNHPPKYPRTISRDHQIDGHGSGTKRHYRKTRKLDVDAADMLNARAQPAHATFREPDSSVRSNLREIDMPSSPVNRPLYSVEGYQPSEVSNTNRLRTYRSLDELSDFLEEESYHFRFGSRSLDDLTEPLYENVFFNTQRANLGHNETGSRVRHSSLSSILDGPPPDLPPRSKNIVSSHRIIEGEETDISVQLAKLKEIARVLGVKLQRGELSASSSVGHSMSSERNRLRRAFALIDDRLQSSAQTSRNLPPGVPARAPVIHDVSFFLNKDQRNLTKEDLEEKRGVSVTSCSPETDCISQESGYSSVDSRTYYSGKHQRKALERAPMTDHNRPLEKESYPQQGIDTYSTRSYLNSSSPPLSEHCEAPTYQRDMTLSPVIKVRVYSSSVMPAADPHLLPCLKSSNPVQSPVCSKKEPLRNISLSSNKPEASYSHEPHISPPQSILKNPYRKTHPAYLHEFPDYEGENQTQLGIYIKSVVSGGAADQDGRLQAGDQLLSVDGKSLVGISQEEAAQYMVGTGSVVTLEVARQGALYHGLAPLLSQPSPQVTRVDMRRASNSRLKERFLSTTIPEVYNERLVEWDHTPIRPPGEQRPPLPHPSNTVSHPTKTQTSPPPTVTIPSVGGGPSAFSVPPRKSTPSMMVDSRSSPNLSVGLPSGTPSDQPRRQTPPLYSDTKINETDLIKGRLSSLNVSMPSLGTAQKTKEVEAKNAPPLHPKPLCSVIPTEPVVTGIRHRGIEETKENPDLPKYTFVPSDDSSPSSGSVCRWRWEERHRCSGHGAGCMPSCRRSSGPTNTATSGDSGIDLSCQACDGKLWRSLSNICDYELISSPLSSLSQSCASIPPPLPPKGIRPTTIFGPHYSCPYIHPRTQKKQSDAEKEDISSSSWQRPLTPSSKPHARSSPNICHLLLHSPRGSSSSSPYISSPSSAPHIGINEERREIPLHATSHIQSQPPTSSSSQHILHQQTHYPHNAQQPRMQSSKSVPSLNSEFHHSPTKSNSHEVFNPAYSRTSSSTSLTQHQQHPHNHQQYPVRSRSTQNLNESSALTLTGRHPSSPALNSEDDRHYQNISFHQGAQDPRMGSQRGGRPPIFPPQSPGREQDHPRPTSAFMHREETSMGRGEVLHRPTSQQNLRPDMRYGGPEDPRKRPNGLPLLQQAAYMSGGYPPNQGMPGGNLPAHRQQYPRGHPKYNYQLGSGPPPQMSPQGYYAPTSAGSPQGIPSQPMSPQYANSPTGRHPPPTAPKPNRNSGSFGQDSGPEKPLRQTSGEGSPQKSNGPPRPPPPEEGYRDSPPPPPPPTSTHPLMQTGLRGVPSSSGSSGMFGKQIGSIKGPWDRDEKEKYESRKREAARRWRDEQISALENLGMKTPQEEERMNTLKLEREFQRRAEERLKDDDEDEDEEDMEDDIDIPPSSTSSRPSNGNVGETQEEDRDKKADEIRRKQRELEAAKEAEERLLREAQRRQEEEILRRHHQQQQRHQTQATQRLESLVGAPHNGTMGNNPRQNYGEHHPPSISPLPPERGSSFSVMHHHQGLETHYSDGSHNRGAPPPAVKRVQFSETSPEETHITYDNNANHEKTTTREDPDDFINEAEMLMNSSPHRGTGSTPGVIGAQEVYRDPRQRRLMEQAQKAAASRGPGPEKLTFREKMKMFAMEAEEGESPKDKMKHSKAQREIEHSASS